MSVNVLSDRKVMWWTLLLLSLAFFLPIEYCSYAPQVGMFEHGEYGKMQVYSYFPLIIHPKLLFLTLLHPLLFLFRLLMYFHSFWFDLNLYVEIYCIISFYKKKVNYYHILLLFLSILELILYYDYTYESPTFAFSTDYSSLIVYQRGLGYYFFIVSQIVLLSGLYCKKVVRRKRIMYP